MNQFIFLIGLRGSGKTTIGKKLAQRLNYNFIDTDLFFVKTEQRSIANAVQSDGWDYFRTKESAILKQVIAPNTVIATGGGIVLADENRKLIKNTGICFFLSAPTYVLAERLMRDPNTSQRPALSSLTLIEELELLLNERSALYLETADQSIDVNQEPEKILDEIITQLHQLSTQEK